MQRTFMSIVLLTIAGSLGFGLAGCGGTGGVGLATTATEAATTATEPGQTATTGGTIVHFVRDLTGEWSGGDHPEQPQLSPLDQARVSLVA